MRHIIYFSSSAQTSGKALSSGDLMKAGRIDIAIHSFIQGVFLSHGFRDDVTFHFIFYGMPDPPKHLEITISNKLDISKKDVGNMIKKMLYKYRAGERTEVFPGCFVEKKSFLKVIEELIEKDVECFMLEKNGKSIRDIKIPKDSCFILGDHDGLPKKEVKRLKQANSIKEISIGPKMYFASQTVAVVNNELDFRGI